MTEEDEAFEAIEKAQQRNALLVDKGCAERGCMGYDSRDGDAPVEMSIHRPWVGLTDEDKLHIEIMGGKSDVMLAEMVEAKLKEKNT
jgi:hypothetical protein